MEEAVQFSNNQKKLYGILHVPDGLVDPSVIVILITGGPQVRTGAHRMYVQLCRFLCEHNWSSFRFDYEGMGDSEGDFIGFQHAGPSIAAAIHFIKSRFKSKPDIIIWSLCDGSTAAALYSATHQDSIIGQILCNPLTITDEGLARSTIRHYYIKRFINIEFLVKLFSFKIHFRDSAKSLWKVLYDTFFLKIKHPESTSEKRLPDMVIDSLHFFSHPVRILLSKHDIVASNFCDELKRNQLLKNDYKNKKIINYFIKGADHTFIEPSAKKEMFEITLKALNEIGLIESDKLSHNHDTYNN